MPAPTWVAGLRLSVATKVELLSAEMLACAGMQKCRVWAALRTAEPTPALRLRAEIRGVAMVALARLKAGIPPDRAIKAEKRLRQAIPGALAIVDQTTAGYCRARVRERRTTIDARTRA